MKQLFAAHDKLRARPSLHARSVGLPPAVGASRIEVLGERCLDSRALVH
jgi:hypothetical protein